ncbi:hypothetical protein [Photobacterium leiognathi]|uniref:hypothetical protein n=1 Tax=Photobacterium leiognathi TaxID=553611 RepID=UPI002982A159|nr:hypothetical protein [Photobacterium leiognathi]
MIKQLSHGQHNPLEGIEAELLIATTTRISRKTITAPLKTLIAKLPDAFLNKSVLHFGKGKANFDSLELINRSKSYSEIDIGTPNADQILKRQYEAIWCCYVLNVLKPSPRNVVINQLSDCCSLNGQCYVAVRSHKDKGIIGKPHLDGVLTNRTRKVTCPVTQETITGKTFQKGYELDEARKELKKHFKYVRYIHQVGAYHILAAAHTQFIES